MYKKIIRPILFLFSPEASHHIVVTLLKFGCSIPGVKWILKKNFMNTTAGLETEVAGIKFPNPDFAMLARACGVEVSGIWWLVSTKSGGGNRCSAQALSETSKSQRPTANRAKTAQR